MTSERALTVVTTQIDALAIGVFLNQMMDKLGGLITAAQNAGNMLEVGAGGQVQQAIIFARTSYEHELNMTIGQLPAVEQTALGNIGSEVNAIQNHAYEQIKEIVDHGALVVNALPISNTLPQVSRFTPSYLLPSLGQETMFSATGNFFDSARPDFEPTLLVNGKPAHILSRTTLALTFSIPRESAPKSETATALVPGVLTVPYLESCYLLFHCRNQATFPFTLVVLPDHAGGLTFTMRETQPTTERQLKTSVEFQQESDQNDIPQPTGMGFQDCSAPDPGWTVVVNSVTPQVTWSQGDQGWGKDWWFNNNTSNVANACYNLTTIYHRIGTSGKVHFVLHYWEERPGTAVQDVPISVSPLEWGSTKLFQLPASTTWTAAYTPFNSRVALDINDVNFVNPYLHVSSSGNTILFATIP